MTDTFDAATVIYGLAVGIVCLLTGLRNCPRSPLVVPALVVVELALIVQALTDVLHLIAGPSPADLATHLGYLITSVLLLPASAMTVHLDERRWGSISLGVGCVVVAVVSIRLHQTLHAPDQA